MMTIHTKNGRWPWPLRSASFRETLAALQSNSENKVKKDNSRDRAR